MKLPVKVFSNKYQPLINQPKLFEVQTASYSRFLNVGLKELLEEIFPIPDFSGKEFELQFVDYFWDDAKYDEERAKFKDLTYEAALRVRCRLVNKKTNANKEQEVYFGDFPLMTDRGTFIINGVERVVVSQLVRSAGVYFTAKLWRGRKLFGAKIIPNRGAWLEFETDPDGFIGVKIDRHRKTAATDLLRVFGLIGDEEIKKTFADADIGPSVKCVERTLQKSPAKDIGGAYAEIYKRIRPGDLATLENAKSLIDAMFHRLDRYDLSVVGRYKLNQRLEIDDKEQSRLLRLEDLVAVVKKIISLNNDQKQEPDDIDHLGNRRVRSVGEQLQNRLRIGFTRMRRIVQDRMSTLDVKTMAPAQLLNARPLISVIKEFFSSSQLSQFMDQINPLAEVEHKRRISAIGPGGLIQKRAGFEVRDVHRSHYGRLCPIQTPEGVNIGLVNHLATFARINELGFIETPYAVVQNGKITGSIQWLNALEEEKFKIAHASVDLSQKADDDLIEARINGEPGTCPKKELDFIDVSPQQFVSVATSLIPFLEHDDANRALMGSNMQRQAVVSVKPQTPYVSTGTEERAAFDSGHLLIAEDDGEIVGVDAVHIVLKTKKENKTYKLNKFKRSNQFTCISQRPLAGKGQKIKKGDLLADGPSIDEGVLALGQNLLTAFVSWEGANFEDAIVLSERVVENDLFTSIHIEDFYSEVRDTKLGPEITTPDIPNISEDRLKNLDEEGIVRIGAEVRSGDILVGKISPKGEAELTPEERLLRAIFSEKARDVKDTSLTMPHGKSGRVIGIKIFSRERGEKLEPGIIKKIQVEIAQLRRVVAGDKLAGRHGNKGVISQVRPVEDMPYLEDGTPVDIILNPLGIAARMNLGQVLETHLGWAASRLNYRAITPALAGASEDEIKAELKKAGLPESGKTVLYDGRTGKPFSQPVTVGFSYIMKLNHLVEDKIHMRSIGPYSLITQQPLGGKAHFGGQRFGEMEVWALEGHGAAHTLQEMLTIKSDDVLGRASVYESIIKGEQIKKPHIPTAFNILVSELKALGLNVDLIEREKPPSANS